MDNVNDDFTTIAAMTDEEFRELLAAYPANEEVSVVDALEIARLHILKILHGTPLASIAPDVRGELATLANIATEALVKDRSRR
jgi:hypothetical protein